MPTETITYTGELVVLRCWCGIRHAVPAELRNHQIAQRDRGQRVDDCYCPLGHSHIPAGETEAGKLKRQLGWERDTVARLRRQVDHKDAQVRGYKGQLTKVKKRAARGICPCCNRSFVNVATHIERQHPDYVAENG